MNCSESLFYIVNEDINVRPNIGVKKKIFAQVRVFEKNFLRAGSPIMPMVWHGFWKKGV